MSSISSVSSSNANTATGSQNGSAVLPANLAASLSMEAGVVATLSNPNATIDSTTALYTNLAKLSTGFSASGGSPSSVDLNADWAKAIQSNPALAPLAAQLTSSQALISAIL